MYLRNISRCVNKQGRLFTAQCKLQRAFSISYNSQRRLFSHHHNSPTTQQHQKRLNSNNGFIANHYAKRYLSSSNGDSFKKFRSFKSGDQYSKKFFNELVDYAVSVAYLPKDRGSSDISNDEGGAFIQNFNRLKPMSDSGEDNFIIAFTEIGLIVGVLDGVGGWSEQGFDSSAISRELAVNVTKVYLENPALKPIDILNEAYSLVKSEGVVEVGSTTICFGIIDAKSKELSALNLGDSWFGVFRKMDDKYKCIFESKEQTYYFNAPYQLSVIPTEFLEQAKKRGSKYLMNEPNEGDQYSFQLQSNDIVIFTTDGLIDNIYPDDIELYLNDQKDEDLYEKIGDVNKLMVNQTNLLSLNTNFKSVFSQRLSKETGQQYIGGKPDDITSVMVYIK